MQHFIPKHKEWYKWLILSHLLLCWGFFQNSLSAQQNGAIRCATMQVDSTLRANQPDMGSLQDFENNLQQAIQDKLQFMQTAHVVDGVYTIPIVVHVIHDGEAIGTGDNISTERILDQIQVLNDDFRRAAGTNGFNTHPDGADTKIEFCLARRRPDGTAFPAGQEGINRIDRNTQGWNPFPYSAAYINANVKPFTTTTQGYDGTVYMNFWVVPISGGILGYAQFPAASLGGSSCNPTNMVTDGVVMTTSSVGGPTFTAGPPPYNIGRTATHEIGHWLGLYHIWGDGNCGVDDFCADTPNSDAPNYNCPTGHVSCGSVDMIENYMDYTNDACMNIFTRDQAMRMRTVLETYRWSLVNSTACFPPNPNDAGVAQVIAPIGDICSNTFTPIVRIKNYGANILNTVTVQSRLDGGAWVSQNFNTLNLAAGAETNLTLNPVLGVALGVHTFEARTILPNGAADPYTPFDASLNSFTYTGGALPITENFEGAIFPANSWIRQNPNNDCVLWVEDSPVSLRGSDGNPTSAIVLRHNDYTGNGQEDILVTPAINLATILGIPILEFDVAHRQRNATSADGLRIEVSTNCGATWAALPAPNAYNKTGAALATLTPASTAAFIPTQASHWRKETINLSAFVGQTIKLRFVATNNNGNNTWIDNINIRDGNIEVAFAAANSTHTENTTATIDCRGYQDISIPVSVNLAPISTAVTVGVTIGAGTATNNIDYQLLTPTLTFPIGSLASQNVVVRVFDDAAQELSETLILNLNVTAGGAVAVAPTSHTLTIVDNNPLILTQILFSEDFETAPLGQVTTTGTSWQQININGGGNNNWVFGENAAMTGNRAAYISNNSTTRPLTYSNTSTSRRRLVSPAINTVGYTNLELSFDFKANGELAGGTLYDYGSLMFATNPAGPYTVLAGNNAATSTGTTPFFGVSTNTTYTVTLPAAAQNQTTLYLVWRWNNDNSAGGNPPFAIDNVVLTGQQTRQVETVLSSKQVYLGANSTVTYISPNGKVMARIENNTAHDYGCTTVEIDRAGTGAAEYEAAGTPNHLTQKSFRITPTNPSTNSLQVTLYYTNAEKTGWEAATSKSWTIDAQIARTGGAISNITAATPTANGATNSLHAINSVAYNTTDHAVSATITNGFGNGNNVGGFAIGDPELCNITAISAGTQTACALATNTYTQQVTVTYQNPVGDLVVNGQTFATTTSPQTVTLTNLPANGAAVNVTASFAGNPACNFTVNNLFTAPASCSVTTGITLGTITPMAYCQGGSISVPFTTVGTFNAGNTFTAQLSDENGNFAAPAATQTGTSPITLNIPLGAIASNNYSVRVISSDPAEISNQTTISINALPTVTLGAFANVCANTPAFALTGGAPAGGTYSGTGVTAGNFNPATAGAGSHTITYSFTDANGCTNTATQNITVNPLPTVTLGAFANVCISAPAFALTGGAPAGGTYSGTGVTAGNFNPATAGAGSHTITYSFTDANGCTNTATQNITVNPLPTVTLGAFANVCISAPAFALTGGAPAGGTYSGTGVTAGNFNPATAGIGIHTITYSFTDANGCTNTATQNIEVTNNIVVSYTEPNNNVCLNATAFALSGGSPAGGTYSGTGVTAGNFNPATAGVGSHTITYTFTSGTCTNSATQTITVNPLPTVTLGAFANVCISAPAFALTGGAPAGGTYSGTGVAAGVFDPSIGAGTYTITYTFTNAAGCTNTATGTITVGAAPCVTNTGGGGAPITCRVPDTFTATPISASSIELTWSGTSNAVSYEIYRNGELITTVAATENSYLDTGLEPSSRYRYLLRALCNTAGTNETIAALAQTLPTSVTLENVREVCGSGRVTLFVSGKSHWQGVYRWYENETDTTPIFESVNGTFETPILSESKTYFVSIFELGQEGARVPVVAIVNEDYEAILLNPRNAQNEIVSCENEVLLEGQTYAGARYAWRLNGYLFGGAEAATFVAKTSGWYEFLVIRGNCVVASTPVKVSLRYAPLAAIQTENDARIFCNPTLLSAAPQTDSTLSVRYEWYLEGTLLGTEGSLEVNTSGVYVLKVIDTNLGCVATTERQITIANLPINPTLTASTLEFCEDETAVIGVTAIAGARYVWFLNNERISANSAQIEVSEGGIYRVVISLPNTPCTASSQEITLTRFEAPQIRIVQEGNELVAQINPASTNFVWQVLDRNAAEGGAFVEVAGSQNQVRFTPAQNGSYRLVVTYGNGCQAHSRSKNFSALTTGTEEEPIVEEGFAIFPNPTKGNLLIRFESSQKELQVRLYDALGRELERLTLQNASEAQLNLSAYANAVYTVEIRTETIQKVVKVVKE
ncbi:T9SS-dependent choice-of-anchor J family protein [Hugenholtzia roseola]|uniref:T9SS-dependent choice-of-anchor J family protein n=1 Tax=Hugenholtzia roseola TaxID=1002 RepID=UPI00040768D9|nr:choice-of-anchor J domain-containing protein [Hugenholtzia roseola]